MSEVLEANRIVKVKTKKDGVETEVELYIVDPTQEIHFEAYKVSNDHYVNALNPGKGHTAALLRVAMEEVVRSQGLWNDEKEANVAEMRLKLGQMEKALLKGGMKKSEGKKLALDIKKQRNDLMRALAARNAGDDRTAEGVAEQAKFDYLVSRCLVYNDNRKQAFFKNMEDYLNKKTDSASIQAATKFAEVFYGSGNQDYFAKLPENKFLKRFGYMDDKLRLVREDGRPVDDEGRLLDEEGRFINEEGKYVDSQGNLVTAEGELIIEEAPFTDE